jgi:protein-tyrosine phosphatase
MEGAARQVTEADFEAYDLLLAADAQNVAALRAVAPDEAAAAKVRLLREFDPAAAAAHDLEVPDPYYGGADGFDDVLDMVDAACRGLLEQLRAEGRV